jgi:hypothetical protein
MGATVLWGVPVLHTHANEAQCSNDCAAAMLFNDLNDDAIDNNVKE